MTKAQLIVEINANIITGGNRTSAAMVRQLLTDMVTWLQGQTSATFGIVANPIGGPGSPVQLLTKYNRIDTSVADGDNAILQPSNVDDEILIQNYSGFAVDILPYGAEKFYGQSPGSAFRIQAGQQLRLFCYAGGEWSQI